MPQTTPTETTGCPSWCAGHDDPEEPTPLRWHRSEGIVVPVVERRQMRLGGDELAPLFAEDYVVAIEQDQRATYVYIGPVDDGRRFLIVTRESAERLHTAIGRAIADTSGPHLEDLS